LFAETSGASPGMGGKWPRDRKLYLEYAAALPALRALRPTEQLIRRCNGAVNRLTACRNKVAHAIHGPPSIEEVGVCLGEWFGNGPDTGKPTLLGDLFTLLNRRE
jgi:hypothetical protein